MPILQCRDSKFTSVLIFGDTLLDNNREPFTVDDAIDYNSTGNFDETLFSS